MKFAEARPYSDPGEGRPQADRYRQFGRGRAGPAASISS
jgi:hypothetical protein